MYYFLKAWIRCAVHEAKQSSFLLCLVPQWSISVLPVHVQDPLWHFVCIQQRGCAVLVWGGWVHVYGWWGGCSRLNCHYLYRQASWGFNDCWDVWELEISNHTEVTSLIGMCVHLYPLYSVLICILKMSNLALAVSWFCMRSNSK